MKKHLSDAAVVDALGELTGTWEALPEWSEAALESSLRALAEEKGLGGGKLIHSVRLAGKQIISAAEIGTAAQFRLQ